VAIAGVIEQREYDRFAETTSGQTAVRVVGSESVGGFNLGATIGEWPLIAVGNRIEATYPTATTEVYTFLKDTVTTVMVLEVGYTDSTKEVFSYVERTT
jgi:hypothetical protein